MAVLLGAAKKTKVAKTLVIMNEKMTKDEVRQLFNYKGPTMFVNNAYNKKLYAEIIDEHLKMLRSKK
jgi:hypothetical protein